MQNLVLSFQNQVKSSRAWRNFLQNNLTLSSELSKFPTLKPTFEMWIKSDVLSATALSLACYYCTVFGVLLLH